LLVEVGAPGSLIPWLGWNGSVAGRKPGPPFRSWGAVSGSLAVPGYGLLWFLLLLGGVCRGALRAGWAPATIRCCTGHTMAPRSLALDGGSSCSPSTAPRSEGTGAPLQDESPVRTSPFRGPSWDRELRHRWCLIWTSRLLRAAHLPGFRAGNVYTSNSPM
jgi:hypothetical protein